MRMIILLFIALIPSFSQAMSREDLPPLLQPWADWAVAEVKDRDCPFLPSTPAPRSKGKAEDQAQVASTRACLWPSRLVLEAGAQGGTFVQEWRLFSESWVPLPGDGDHWPEEVTINKTTRPILSRQGKPGLLLPAGHHVISGRLPWNRLPEFLAIPGETGLISLTLEGREIPFPHLDQEGRLWLQAKRTEGKEEKESLEIAVHRKIQDGVPVTLVTRVELGVAGRNREIVLSQPIHENWIPMTLHSPLPARLEEDGRIRIQARPGQWSLEWVSRSPSPLTQLPLPPRPGNDWPEEEIWVFQAQPHLRVVEITGVPGVDPTNTRLPEEWRSLPAYLLHSGEKMVFSEKKRGNPDPDPDKLSLTRTIWLDFQGEGLTFQDGMTGVLNRSLRLSLNPPAELGRVAVNEVDQLITQLEKDKGIGVEVRGHDLKLTADSRLEGAVRTFAATGWAHDFDSLSATLHLPPGWRLFYATGVDVAYPTWIGQWTLLDLFLVLVTGMALGKLWGRSWGGLALLALVINHQESSALTWTLLLLTIAMALTRVVPAGWFERLVRLFRNLAILTLVITLVPHLVEQFRQLIHPQLELPYSSAMPVPGTAWGAKQYQASPQEYQQQNMLNQQPLQSNANIMPEMLQQEMMAKEETAKAKSMAPPPPPAAPAIPRAYKGGRGDSYSSYSDGAISPSYTRKLAEVDPNAQVQTGPGIPNWTWKQVSLTWNGPVEKEQMLSLFLIPPTATRLLHLLAALLAAVVSVRAAGFWPVRRPPAAVLLLPLFLLAMDPPRAEAQTIPSPEMMKELRERLLEPAKCLPQCADINRLAVEAKPDRLLLRMEVHAGASAALPLPGRARLWLPSQVMVDGQPAEGLLRQADGTLQVKLDAGIHQLVLEGPLAKETRVEIPLPLPPRHIRIQSTGWEVEGLDPEGHSQGSLQLTRSSSNNTTKENQSNQETFSAQILPPFFRVERTLFLGLTWEVETIITRLTPADSGALLQIPLLPGESVTSAGITVLNGTVRLNLSPGQKNVSWRSLLKQTESLEMIASQEPSWMESWQLQASPLWHVTYTGIPPVRHHLEDKWSPLWRPWPGEKTTLSISRPQALAGKTLTLEETLLQVTPGLRGSKATLSFTMKSSQGGRHAITLPQGVELLSVTRQGKTLPMERKGDQVILPISPGSQDYVVTWRDQEAMGMLFSTPGVDMGLAGVNFGVRIEMPQDRWTLFLGGPILGPGVLYWGVLGVVFLIALGLGRIPWLPLATRDWLLLGVGLSTVLDERAILVVGWFLIMAHRLRHPGRDSKRMFNFRQVILLIFTLFAASSLISSIEQGLLGLPDMRIEGNGSSYAELNWFKDRTEATIPQAWVVSLPLLLSYRLLMLLWALWIARAVLSWAKWGWECFSDGGVWEKSEIPLKESWKKKNDPPPPIEDHPLT